MNKIDIKTLTFEELEEAILNICRNEKKFRVLQIFDWLHNKHVNSFEEMSNLSQNLREILKQNFQITEIKMIEKLVSKEDSTTKFLFKLENNYVIESVLMKYDYGNAVCISSQVGCKMGCNFCASTLDGLERNLTAGEMLSQIYMVQKEIGERIRSIVLMGSGEPFDNFDNLMSFLNIVNDKKGLNLGQRHITVSTCGIVPKIYEFADKKMQVNLALSLHAPNDELRQTIMPIAKKYSVEETILACKYFAKVTKRRVTYEYALIEGVNDTLECVNEIIMLLRGSLAHVNLIPINDVKERGYKKSSKNTIKQFANTLQNAGIETTIRRTLGSDINASCGQLRKSYKY